MKAIMVMFDTLNRRHLPPYGCEWTHAPNFARLAERTVVFENAYVSSMPCMPARRELHTGRYNFLHRSWGPLEPFDDSMPELLKQHGIHTHLITDHQHYWEDGGATYHTRYSTCELIRGQEGDPWKGVVGDFPTPPKTTNHPDAMWRQDWINRSYMPEEQDQPQPQVFQLGEEFIRRNADADDWFLQIETFDPHEPFFTHEKYKELYPHGYDGPHFDWPPYAPVTEPPEMVEHMRFEYAALLSMCDHYLGKVLDLMDELNLWDDTMLIVNTDHGFLLGEHAWWAKMVQPMYNEIAHVPLLIWDPRSRIQGQRRRSLVQMIDMAPTLLDYFDVPIPVDMQGRPLRAVIEDDQPLREAGLFGIFGGHVNVADGRYVYMRSCASPDNEPCFEYTLMPTHMRSRFDVDELQDIQLAEPFSFTKGCRLIKAPARFRFNPSPYGTMLFDVQEDPEQQTPLTDAELEDRLLRHLVALMRENDAPSEQFERLGIDSRAAEDGRNE
ncbi:MAG: sulfatase [Caldilinea sp.]